MKKLLLIALLALSANTYGQWASTGKDALDLKWEKQVRTKVKELEKEVGMISIRYAGEKSDEFDGENPDFKWWVTSKGDKWEYLKIQVEEAVCDKVIVALFDANDNFLVKETVYLDFGVGETLVEGTYSRRAKTAKIRCD